jgi:DNA-binding transcriptional MerR regulator
MATLLTVRAAAASLGVHENTLRNWESRGLIRAIHLPHSNFRRFDAAQIERMRVEMLTQLASADEGRVISPQKKIIGKVVHGDL